MMVVLQKLGRSKASSIRKRHTWTCRQASRPYTRSAFHSSVLPSLPVACTLIYFWFGTRLGCHRPPSSQTVVFDCGHISSYLSCLPSCQELKQTKFVWPFLKAVDPEEYPQYYEEIETPIDLAIIGQRVRNRQYVVLLGQHDDDDHDDDASSCLSPK